MGRQMAKMFGLPIALIATVAVVGAQAPTPATAIKDLQGKWQVIRFVDHSEEAAPADEIKEMSFEFRDDQIVQRRDKDDPGRLMKYRLDPTKKPRQFDIETLGWAPGIYKIEGDELSICVVAGQIGNATPARPTEFRPSKTGPHTLFVLKRAKAQ